MKMLFYTNLKFHLLLSIFFVLSQQTVFAQENLSTAIVADTEFSQATKSKQTALEIKVNLLLTSIRQRLAVPHVSERYQTVLADQINAKAELKCPSIPLKRLLNSNNRFAYNEGMVREEVYYLAELLQNLNVLLNQ